MGNLTVFPGGHLRDWRQYPDWKRDKAALRTSAGPTRSRSASAAVLCHLSYRTAAAATTAERNGTSCSSGCNWRASTTRTPEHAAALLADPGPSCGFRRRLNLPCRVIA